jgi:LmbE family N-acetylglucosaminyl deacetylase
LLKARAIFYIPHADDEAIGMAGSIQRLKEEGVLVYLVLLTDGYNTKALEILNGDRFCSWHRTYHCLNISMEELMRARLAEFTASARSLGADQFFIINNGRGLPDLVSPAATSYSEFVEDVKTVVRGFNQEYPGSAHHFTSGPADSFGHSRQCPQGKIQPTHLACWEVATSLRDVLPEVVFHRVYVYLKPKSMRVSGQAVRVQPVWRDKKKTALAQYALFSPQAGRYAIGYHSAGNIIDAAFLDDMEYLDEDL